MNNFEITWASLWRIFFMLLLVITFVLAKEAIVILFLALIISSAIDSPINYLERKKIPRILGTLIIFLIGFSILFLILYAIAPIIFFELKDLIKSFGGLEIPIFENLGVPQILEQLEKGFSDFAEALLVGGASVFGIITSIFGGVVFVLTAFVLSFYLAASRNGVEKFLKVILPNAYERRVISVYVKAKTRMGLWLQGQIFLSVIVGTITALGLWILGVDHSLLLGVLAGVFEIVPFVGPIFAGLLAFMVAITTSLELGIYVLIFFIIVQQLESHILVPFVMKRTVELHPVIVVISLVAGSQIAGFIGIILAIPAAVILQEIVEDWSERKQHKLI